MEIENGSPGGGGPLNCCGGGTVYPGGGRVGGIGRRVGGATTELAA